MRYQVFDRHTNSFVGASYSSKTRAARRADRLDLEYGAYRYTVREVRE